MDLQKYPETNWLVIYHYNHEDTLHKDVQTKKKPCVERDLKHIFNQMRNVCLLRPLKRCIFIVIGDGHSYNELVPEVLQTTISNGVFKDLFLDRHNSKLLFNWLFCVPVALKKKRTDEALAATGKLELMRVTIPDDSSFMFMTEFVLTFKTSIKQKEKRKVPDHKWNATKGGKDYKGLAKFDGEIESFGSLESIIPGWKHTFARVLSPNSETHTRSVMIRKGGSILVNKWALFLDKPSNYRETFRPLKMCYVFDQFLPSFVVSRNWLKKFNLFCSKEGNEHLEV